MLAKALILQLNQSINLKQFLFFVFFSLFTVYGVTAQVADSSVRASKPVHSLNDLLVKNFLLDAYSKPVANFQQVRKIVSQDLIFYILLGLVFYLAVLRAAFPRYFVNLIRVFFNTSLRQSQLTDQLLQARLPALCINIFFACIGGVFLYLILNKLDISSSNNSWKVLLYTIPAIALVYLGKYFILLFTGWLTGFKQEAGTYLFIVFLFNKILSLFLLPLAVVIAFAETSIAQIGLMISFILIGLWLLLRFYRSYSLLQHRLKVSSFHFFLYVIGIEILPILLIYKAAMLIMLKNL
jgi:hypothetical protein